MNTETLQAIANSWKTAYRAPSPNWVLMDKVLPQPGVTMLGEYAHLAGHGSGSSTTESIAYREGQLGRIFALDHTQFYDMHDTNWPGDLERLAVTRGHQVVVSVRGYPPNEVNTGTHDAQITAAAKRAIGFSHPLLIRYAWEMNGNWFNWSPLLHRERERPGGVCAGMEAHG